MLTKDDQTTIENVMRHTPAFADVLRRALAREQEALISLVPADQLRVAQGRAQCLRDLLRALESTRKGPTT